MDELEGRRLVELASADPADAERRSLAALDEHSDSVWPLWALGLAQRNLGRPTESVATLTAAVDAAGTEPPVGEVQLTLAASLLAVGRPGDALALLEAVDVGDDSLLAARRAHQRGSVLQRQGDNAAARRDYEFAARCFDERGDDLWAGHLHTNLGIMACYEGDTTLALAELAAAADHYAAAGHEAWEAWTLHNTAWVEGCAGDFPRALERYNEADERFRRLGIDEGPLLAVRAETMIAAGLVAEARVELDAALRELDSRELGTDYAEALLLVAEAAEHQGDLSAALAHGRAAVEALERQQREGWVAVAAARVFATMCRAGLDRDEMLAEGARRRADLEAWGFAPGVRSLDVAVAAGLAVAGHVDEARGRLAAVAPPTHPGEVRDDARGALAIASAELAAGRVDVALATLDRAHRALRDEERRAVGLDMGHEHGELTRRIARLAFAAALAASEGRGGDEAATWGRRCLHLGRPWRPVVDDEARRLLARLRALDGDVRNAATPADDPGVASEALRRRLAHRRWAWTDGETLPDNTASDNTASDNTASDGAGGVELDLVVTGLDGGDAIVAVVHPRSATPEVVLGPALSAAMQVRATARVTSYGAMGLDALRSKLAWFDDLVPTGDASERLRVRCDERLGGLPLGAGVALAQRPFDLVREIDRAPRPATVPERAVALLGPGVSHDREALRRLGFELVDLVDLAAVERAVAGTDLLYVGAHGSVAHGRPLFSSLEAESGPVFAHDLPLVGTLPATVVLGACDAGATGQGPGVGFSLADALLLAGADRVVAPVTPVQDDAGLARFLEATLAALLEGRPPADVLAERRRLADPDDPLAALFLSVTGAPSTVEPG